jgi:hypothetical protein
MGREERIVMEIETKKKSFSLDLTNYARFKMAPFERGRRDFHVKSLKTSIMDKGLLKKDITVWEDSDGKYFVMDGQHRMNALNELLEEGYKKSFMIDLVIMPGMDGVEAKKTYIEINTKIKTLTPNDILKVFSDDVNNAFFVSMSEFCKHYGDKSHLTFFNVLQALKYAKVGGSGVCIKRYEIEQWATTASKWEVERLKQFMGCMTSTIGYDTGYWMYKTAIFRNMMRIYWDNYTEMVPKLQKFMRLVQKDKFLNDNSQGRTIETVQTIYEYMTKLLKNKLDVG